MFTSTCTRTCTMYLYIHRRIRYLFVISSNVYGWLPKQQFREMDSIIVNFGSMHFVSCLHEINSEFEQ